ncbi:hypothetical protein CYMTET_27293 [Cymbomonas tetramitiformis]|uniref:Uncharacterized protein n=1 Tax=Cymbomonas tetramitiformis TaxID=36881 RepID=A0AAE0FQ44_9CHLO|nr:hypothetical protein CYMTET_27293 [Cymbomonas tetramitiformis]
MANPKAPKAARVEASPKPPTTKPKFKGDFCWNFNKQKGCAKAVCTHPHVVYGLSLDTRYTHALLAQAMGRYLHLTDKVVQDLKVIVTVIRLYNWRKVWLDRVEIKWEWFSSDASTVKGMGALFFVCVQHAVRLRPVYISSEDNIYSDLLSRDWVEFRTMFETDKQKLVWIEDRGDWMLIPTLWHPLDVQSGPFTVDCCVSENSANSFCRVGWTKVDNARLMDFSGHNALGNLPFSDFIDIVRNFLCCKRREQHGTSATFLAPWWPGNPGFELVASLPGVFRMVRRWKHKSALFTAPSPEGGRRTFGGTTDWPVTVVHCPPCEVFWTDTELTGVTMAMGFLDRMLPAEDDVLADWVVHMVTERAVKPDTAKK